MIINYFSFIENDQVCMVLLDKENETCQPIEIVDFIYMTICDKEPSLVLMEDKILSRVIAARLAYRMKGTSLTSVDSLEYCKESFKAEKKIYAENLKGTFEIKEKPLVITCSDQFVLKNCIEDCNWEKLKKNATDSADIICKGLNANRIEYEEHHVHDRLKEAGIVVVGGRGTASEKGKTMLKEIADRLSAEIGATRPTVMDGIWGFNQLVGASGKKLAADLVITFGVSGAAPFIAGLTNCSCVIAVNNNKNAPVFNSSDYGIVSDYQTVIEYLLETIK